MIAILASFVLLCYVVLPGVVFRRAFSLYIPLRQFQRTRTQEITVAVVASVAPFLLAAFLARHGWLPTLPILHFRDSPLPQWLDYRRFLEGLYSESSFLKDPSQFWESSIRVVKRQGNLLLWYYAFTFLEALVLGALSKNYGTLRSGRGGRLYERWAGEFLLKNISEWHALLTPFTFAKNPPRKVLVDVITSDDHLYRGEVGDYYIDTNGRLTGILLDDTYRFDRKGYLTDKQLGQPRAKSEYWKAIPGENLYLAADRISTLNLSYEENVSGTIKKAVEQIETGLTVKVEEAGMTDEAQVALGQSNPYHDLFPVDGHEFTTLRGKVTARVVKYPYPVGTDQVWYKLKFSDGRVLTIVLSDAGLHHDPDGTYKARAFDKIQQWLEQGGDDKIEFFD